MTSSSSTDYCGELAKMACAVRFSDVQEPVKAALTRTLIDTIGVAIASVPEDFATEIHVAARHLFGEPSGKAGCTVIGSGRLAAGGAALVNGTLGHGWDFDDVHLPSLAHFSTIVIPAAMAACELFGADGQTFLEGVLVGDEVGGRIGWAVCSDEWGGTAIRNRGFFPTAILGTIAAAVAVAKIARLDVMQTTHAIAIAASHAGGLASISRGDNSTKRTQAGWAAQAGLAAALLAKEGFTGPKSVLETNQGFFQAFTGNMYRSEALVRRPGAPWIVEEMSYKARPLEYIIHPLVELAAQARAALGETLEQVTSIEASAASKFVTLFQPQAAKVAPAAPHEALISAPYCIARTLLKSGDEGLLLNDFQRAYVLDKHTTMLARKVVFVEEPAFDKRFPQHISGRLRFKAGKDTLWVGELADVYGSPSRPMSDQVMAEKFHVCSAHWPAARRDETLKLLREISQQKDASWVARLGIGSTGD